MSKRRTLGSSPQEYSCPLCKLSCADRSTDNDDLECGVRAVIRSTYVIQEKNLSVHSIIGKLYQEKIISKTVKERICAQTTSLEKARVLLDHLENTDAATLKNYCAILERSAEEDGIKSHQVVAQRIMAVLGSCESDESLQEVIQYLEFHPVEDNFCPEDQYSTNIVPYRIPQRLGRVGTLKSPLFKRAFDLLFQMLQGDPVRARLTVESIQKHKEFPVDLRAALTQAGAGFTSESIPLLHHALDLCKRDDCQNPSLIECRIHWQLMWCHDKLGEVEKRDDHLAQALCQANSIGPDFSAAFIFGWKAYIQICSCKESISRDLEKETRELLNRAMDCIEGCLEIKWFAQALRLYKADWHSMVAKSYTHKNLLDTATAHEDSAKECTRHFGAPQEEDIQKVELMTRDVLSESRLGTLSQFGQYTCQLYLKFGQYQRARMVLCLVGDRRVLECIDIIEKRARREGLLVC